MEAHDKEKLDANIRRTAGIAALRKIRGIVDEYEREERAGHRLSRRIVLGLAGVLVVIAVLWAGNWLGPVLRSLSGVIS